MPDMPRPRPPHVQREVSRHGKVVWYYRKGEGKRTRLKGEYQSEEWWEHYRAAADGRKREDVAEKTASGSLRWLVDRYFKSSAFLGLAPATQRMRANVLKVVCRTGGDMRISDLTRGALAAGRDRRASTPFAALTYLKTMSQLFEWAIDAEYMTHNPAKEVKRPSSETEGFEPWSDEHIITFCEAYPIGTRERLAMDLMLFTGLARSDAIKVGRQHVRDGVIEYRRTKTAHPIFIPILPPLQASIDATPTGDLTFLTNSHGRPWKSAASFGNQFSGWCKNIGLPVRSHGLRKRIAKIMAEGGAPTQQLKAYFGWATDAMAAHYTRRADARRMAVLASEGLNVNSLSPHLEYGAGLSVKTPTKSTVEN